MRSIDSSDGSPGLFRLGGGAGDLVGEVMLVCEEGESARPD